jgi:lysophospholipid acyltransferase
MWFLYAFCFASRTKYYGVWSLTEGACILSGLGYNGLDANKKARWDRVTNVDPWALETAQNTRAYLEAWNMNTNKWLKNYVYLRVTPKGKKPGFRSSLTTFGTSGMNQQPPCYCFDVANDRTSSLAWHLAWLLPHFHHRFIGSDHSQT